MFQAKAKLRNRSDSKSLRTRGSHHRRDSRSLRLESLEPRMMLTATPGAWTALTNATSDANLGTMELQSDGSVMITVNTAQAWDKLTPNASGSYVNAAWSPLSSMSTLRLYDATNVLKDGRVMVLGGQYTNPPYTQTNTNTGEIYNPLTNVWTAMAPFPEANFGNDPTMLLLDGRVLAGSKVGPNTFIYDPTADTWSPGPTKPDGDPSWGESWTKLPDGTILSVDIWDTVGQAERLDPTTMTWSVSGSVPAGMQVPGKALGPAMLLPDGRLFQVGGVNSNTALYDPSAGAWASGPVVPGGFDAHHSSAAMMPNGHVLFAVGGDVDGPIHFFEFDPADSSLTDVSPTFSLTTSSQPFVTRMLALPSGQVLAVVPGGAAGKLYVYTPVGSPQAAWQPTISSVANNGDGTFTLTGTQLNGLSAGASYGSFNEMDSNYPIVELQATDGSGKVYFARTFNWSSTGVATGNTPVNTEFATAAFMPYGTYNLSVIANGIASAPVSFTGGVVGPSADLAVTNNGPTTSTEGANATYSLTVTNNGPTTATNVVLTDTPGANLKYVSATKSQGTSSQSGSVVTFSFGTVAVGQTVTATVTAQATEDGSLSNSASVTSNLPDANLNNNSSVVTTAVAEDSIVISAPKTVSGKNQNNVTVATFTHASGVEPTNAFVATINWGDNSTSQGTITQSGAIYTVKGSHTYAKNSTYTVTTTVVEAGGSPNFAAASLSSGAGTTSGATASTPSASASAGGNGSGVTSSSASGSKAARDAMFASPGSFDASNGPSMSAPNAAGADLVPNTDGLDAIFESLGADMLSTGKGIGG